MNRIYGAFLFLGIGWATVWSFLAPPSKGFREPDLARIIFFHLPSAFVATVFLFFASWLGIRFLMTENLALDARSEAAHSLAGLFSVATMVSGILFSYVQWGQWWQNDPRQTSFLLVLLILGAYFAIRATFSDPIRRARNSAAFAVGSLLPNLFLIFVFPKLPQVASFHPQVIGRKGGFDPLYWAILGTVFIFLLLFAVVAYRLRVRASQLETSLEKLDAELDARRYHATDRMVRPVPLPETGLDEDRRS